MPTNYELYHHGIKGQKWYIRRFQPYPKGEKPKGAKEIGEAKTVRQRIDEVKSKNLSIEDQFNWDYRKENDMVLNKGDYLYRADARSKINPDRQALYASLKRNHLGYLNSSMEKNGMSIDLTTDNGNNGNPYSIKLKLQEDLFIPSYRKAVNTFIDTIKDLPAGEGVYHDPDPIWGRDANYDSDSLKAYSDIQGKGRHFIKKTLKENKARSVDVLKNRAYATFMDNLFMDGDRRKLFFDSLEKQGYNCIVDDNDYNPNTGYYGAVVIFKKGSVKQVESKPVLKSDEYYIYKSQSDMSDSELIKNYPKQHKEWEDWMSDKPKKKR